MPLGSDRTTYRRTTYQPNEPEKSNGYHPEQIRNQITKQIIEALEKGGMPPWRQPWIGTANTGRPANVVSSKPYRGINPLLLSLHQHRHGFSVSVVRYLQSVAGHGRTGSCGGPTTCRRANGAAGSSTTAPITKTVTDPITGEETEEKYPLLKTYSVFSVDQVEGDHLDHLRARDDGPVNLNFVDFEPAELAIRATQADIRFKGDRAFYHRGGDYIQMPPKGKFPKESRSSMPFASTRLGIGARNEPNGPATTPKGNCERRSPPPTCWQSWACRNPRT